jgi:hypothetical protein
MAAWSKAWVCGRPFAGDVGSNTAGDMDICFVWVLSGRGLCDSPIARAESPTDCGVSECDREGGPGPLGAVALWTTIQY